VESDATPHTPDSSVSIPPTVTLDENHVVDEDSEDTENQGQVISQVYDSVVTGRGRRN